jgi:hypothetical protein
MAVPPPQRPAPHAQPRSRSAAPAVAPEPALEPAQSAPRPPALAVTGAPAERRETTFPARLENVTRRHAQAQTLAPIAPTPPASVTRPEPRDAAPAQPRIREALRPALPADVRVAERMPDKPESAPPQPTIHVSIGRVEIRAVTAPAQPVRAPAKTASLSLEQFLAQQKERGMR